MRKTLQWVLDRNILLEVKSLLQITICNSFDRIKRRINAACQEFTKRYPSKAVLEGNVATCSSVCHCLIQGYKNNLKIRWIKENVIL